MKEPTQRPAQHYAEAQRILAALPRHGLHTSQLTVLEPLAAIAHAILATVPPRRVRVAGRNERRPAGGGSLAERWIRGDFDEPQQ
jgi:hypothetical protein